MALLLCHITPSESDPGSVELTVLHTGVMACIIGAKDNATNIIQDSNVHWNKFCSYDEWKRSVEVCTRMSFSRFSIKIIYIDAQTIA